MTRIALVSTLLLTGACRKPPPEAPKELGELGAFLFANFEASDDEGLAERAARIGGRLMDGLRVMSGRFEFMGGVRGRGLMIAVDFVRPHSLKLRTAWKMVNALSPDLFCQAVTMPLLEKHGILTQVAGHGMATIKLIPPLVLDEEDVDMFLRAFEDVMEDLHRFPGPAWESLSRIARNALSSGAKGS